MSLSFAELSVEDVEKSVLTSYEAIAKTTLYPGDPVRLFLESLAYVLAIQNSVVDMAGKANLLQFASGEHLDAIGLMTGTKRLDASSASATLKFTLQEALDFDVEIPSGTKAATADGKTIFATDKSVIIQGGSLTGTVSASAQAAGSDANGFVAGQICVLVDPVAYVASVENTTTTMLGADVETDAHYRQRIQESPEAYTCAGPSGMYRALAMGVSQDIADVSVSCPKPGTVDVRPVLAGGEFPSDEVLEAVRAKLSADDVRPLTDTVIVQSPDGVSYDLDVTWYLSKADEALLSTISSAVTSAVNSYILWQRCKPGRDILPTKLISLMEQAGARRVVVRSPVYTVLKESEIAREGTVSIAYGGIEEE